MIPGRPTPTHGVTAPRHADVPAPCQDAPAFSFDRVYQDHAAFVFRVLRALGVRDAQADDALQDVFVVVHQRLAAFDGRARITSWLFAIAVRVASTHRRRSARRGVDASEQELAISEGSASNPAEDHEQVRRVQTILDTLDDDKRRVLVLADIEGMTAPEIAELCGIPLNTVYTRLRRARAAFAARWQNERTTP